MTKPMNFPERKNQRRKDALARLKAYCKYYPPSKQRGRHPRHFEVAHLESLIVDSALHIRTKKVAAGRPKPK